MGVLIRPEVRIDLWTERADALVDDFATRLPSGLAIREVMDQADYVSERLSSLVMNLGMGGAAVCLVILLLMGWRSAVVVASALPLTVCTVLFGMRILGIPVHQMSITGLVIALGLLIDNAIVVTDEIRMELLHGRSSAEAVKSAVGKLSIPLLGSTLTTVFAFAPIALMPGPAGEFVGSIALNVVMAILASLCFSLTVIAAFAALFIRVADFGGGDTVRHGERRGVVGSMLVGGFRSRRLSEVYGKALLWLFMRPKRASAFAVLFPLLGFALAPMLPEQFFPASDRDQFYVEVELAPGASINQTRRVSHRIDEVLAKYDARQVDWYFADSGPTFYYNVIANRRGTPGFAQAIVRLAPVSLDPVSLDPVSLDPGRSVPDVIRELQTELDHQVADARVLVRQLEQGPPFNAPIEVRIFGPDLEKLQEYGEHVRQVLAGVPDVTHTASLLSETLPQVALDVDAQAARLAGLTPERIADQVQASFDGRIGGLLIQETEQLPVRVRFNDSVRSELDRIKTLDLVVPTAPGIESRVVPLGSLAEIGLKPETGVIVRLDRRRMNEVSAYLTAGTLPPKALTEFSQRLDESGFKLPAGYELRYGGEASKRNDAVGNLLASVGVLVAMIVTTLVLSFGSFRLAGVIGGVGALSVGLGLFAIWAGGYPFGFMAIIGCMGLVGIAINDSIVVLATLQKEHGRHALNPEAVVGSVVRCTRHVVATTLTTVAGFSPLIWDGGLFWPPLAVAIAGGVVGATLLALVFVPSMFRLVFCTIGNEP